MFKNGDWVKWVLGIVIMGMVTMIGYIYANDDKSRGRDEKITGEIVIGQKEQQKVNQDILMLLTELKIDIKYLKQNADKPNGNN